MAALKPDVLLAIALSPTLALKKVHGDVPLVFLGSLDPLALGVVDSLAKRTEAITGITAQGYDLSGKRLHILKDVRLRRSSKSSATLRLTPGRPSMRLYAAA
jgi:putative ABC transport system substrate-binding protein